MAFKALTALKIPLICYFDRTTCVASFREQSSEERIWI